MCFLSCVSLSNTLGKCSVKYLYNTVYIYIYIYIYKY